jgi:DNA-binding transcriptional LysR family regulator
MEFIWMEQTPPFAALLAFESAARLLSFKAAAEELHITPSAISHRLRALEQLLGVQLFVRSPKGLSLSMPGRAYLLQIQDIFARVTAASRCLKVDAKDESLSIHSTPTFATLWLMPSMSGFVAANPRIQFTVDASPAPANFTSDQVDVDIRYGRPNGFDLHSEALNRDRISAFCSPSYFRKLGSPLKPQELRDAAFIHLQLNAIQWSDWLAANDAETIDVSFRLHSDRSLLAIQAAVEGLGIVLESHLLCGHYVRSGALIKMFPESRDIEWTSYYLVCPKPRLDVPVIRMFRDWLVTTLRSGNELHP